MKTTQINGSNEASRAVNFKIDSFFLAISTMYVILRKKIKAKEYFNYRNNKKRYIY